MKEGGSFTFGWEVGAFTENEHVIVSENFLLFFTLLCGCLILQHLVSEVWKVRYMPESLATILVAVLVGGLLRLLIENRTAFSPLIIGFSSEIFYFGLLPPIIFNSGYHLRRRLLYGNLGAVLVLAFVGTCLSTALTSAGIQLVQHSLPHAPIMSVVEATAFACVIAANDPISTLAIFARLKLDPALYYAVLGESVLNDAVAITAFRVTARLIGATHFSYIDGIACVVNFFILVAGSSIIGYGVAVIVASLLRHLHFGRNKVVPIGVVICTIYIPFFLTEMLQLSGIVTIFFTGIAARRYVHKNLTLEVRKLSAFVFNLLTHVSETTCFVLLGLCVFLTDFPAVLWPYMLTVLALCLLSRPLAVYPLLTVLNLYRTLVHPPGKDGANIEAVPACGVAAERESPDESPDSLLASVCTPPRPLQPSASDASLDTKLILAEEGITEEGPVSEPAAHPSGQDTACAQTPITATTKTRAPALPLTEPLSWSHMHVIAFAGMRGAVSFSLAYIFPDDNGNRNVVLCTTIIIVLVTSFVQGCLMEPLIRYLGIKTSVDFADYLKNRTSTSAQQTGLEKWLLYPFVVKPRGGGGGGASYQPLHGAAQQADRDTTDTGTDRMNPLEHEDDIFPGGYEEDASDAAEVGHYALGAAPSRGNLPFHAPPGLQSLSVTKKDALRDSPPADDTASSGGGSLVSCDDEQRRSPGSPFPVRRSLPRAVSYCEGVADPRQVSYQHKRNLPAIPVMVPERRGRGTGALQRAMSLQQLPVTHLSVSRNATRLPGAARGFSSVMTELEQVLVSRALGATSPGGTYHSPVPNAAAGVSADAAVFNHLRAPNPFFRAAHQRLDAAAAFSSGQYGVNRVPPSDVIEKESTAGQRNDASDRAENTRDASGIAAADVSPGTSGTGNSRSSAGVSGGESCSSSTTGSDFKSAHGDL